MWLHARLAASAAHLDSPRRWVLTIRSDLAASNARRKAQATMAALASIDSGAEDGRGAYTHRKRPVKAARVVTPRDTEVCARCEIADKALQRMHGLLGRDGLQPGEGMLIKPASSVHTMFMRFPIDVVFLDRAHRIVGIAHTLRPWRAAGARRAKAALELPAGTAAAHGLEVGDVLTIEPV